MGKGRRTSTSTESTSQTSLIVTLRELIDSGLLSECSFSYGDENDALVAIHDDPSGQGVRKNSPLVWNATKIALLAAKTFARYEEEGNTHLLSVSLEQITVHLLSSEPGHTQQANKMLSKEHPSLVVCENTHWNLAGMCIVTMEVSPQWLSSESTLRHLGKIIYALFSQNKTLLMPSKDHPEHEDPVVSDSESSDFSNILHPTRLVKRGRSGKSLFFRLQEEGGYPVSVCRLLSDMIDVGVSGKSEFPFGSLKDVIDDLEHMASHPNIYLYDAVENFTLGFGQRYYGQKKEMSQLLQISMSLEQSVQSSPVSSALTPAEVVFVSGMPGIGKTHLVSRVGDFLSSLGCWIVAKIKFERGAERKSRQCLFSLFHQLVARIVEMKDGHSEAESSYNLRASKAISDVIDPSGLCILANYIPSIRELIPTAAKRVSIDCEMNLKPWQVTFLLSRLMGALLSLDRFVMLCVDDLQWCEPRIMGMLNEIIVQAGDNKWRCICVGTFRSNEVHYDSHPLMMHFDHLKESKHTNVTEMKLSSLSRDDVIEMLMNEMRLPRRLVLALADIVHKKTVGHALFIVQLLNSLVRDGTISYSPRKLQYDYDQKDLASVKTGESIATIIIANLELLSENDLQNLRIICCFGRQSYVSILHLIEGCPCVQSIGMLSSISTLVSNGILEQAGPVLEFSHDLIHQQVYENMTAEQRTQLQVNIGSFLGSLARLDDAPTEITSIEASVQQLNLSEENNRNNMQLGRILLTAVDLINSAGPECIELESQSVRFAKWNLFAAVEHKKKGNFQSVLHYCKNGISFLGKDIWSESQLSRELYEGAAFASYAIGNATDTKHYAEEIVEHVRFEESLFAQLMILRSLESADEHQHVIARGLAILRSLNFNIPKPTPFTVMETLVKTGSAASKYSMEDIISMQTSTTVDSSKRNALNIVGAVSMACYQTASPYYPLLICAIVNHSLENGVCVESGAAFALLGYYQIYLEGNYDSGKHWGDVAEKILERSTKPNDGRAVLTLKSFLFLWYKPLEKLANDLFDLYEVGMKTGNIDGAMYALCQYWRFSFARGEKLSILSLSYNRFMESMVSFTLLSIFSSTQSMSYNGCPFLLSRLNTALQS